MSDALQLLGDLDDFLAASGDARARALATLARRLGQEWAAEALVPGEDGLPLLHRASGLRFVAVPGGRFEMGFSPADLDVAADFLQSDPGAMEYVEELTATARPPRSVLVRPFLLARELLAEHGEPVDLDRDEALRRAASAGLRLPSEAELEWIARDGGELTFTLEGASQLDPTKLVSRFGVAQFHLYQWASDDWHPSFDGAPTDSSSWGGGGANGVYRSGFDLRGSQAEADVALALAAVRSPGDGAQRCHLRLARDVPRG